MARPPRVVVRTRLRELRYRVDRGTRAGLFLAANHLKNHAQRLAPVDTGFLQNYLTALVGPGLGTVTAGTREHNEQKSVTIPRGTAVVGSAASYARYVHEIPPERAHHPVGQWKFLEQPARENAKEYAKMIRDALRASVDA